MSSPSSYWRTVCAARLPLENSSDKVLYESTVFAWILRDKKERHPWDAGRPSTVRRLDSCAAPSRLSQPDCLLLASPWAAGSLARALLIAVRVTALSR